MTTTDGAAITWDELFGEFAPALVSFARSKGIRAPEDLVQDVFVTAVDKLSEFQGDRRGLRSWLFSITYRRIADEHRRFYRSPELLVGEHASIEDFDSDVDGAVVRGADAKEAFAALEVLRERERTVLEMRIIEEATPAEVARRLDISAGNVRVIQARALVKIRKHLKTTRNADSPSSIAYGGMSLIFFQYMGSGRPGDEIIGPWIEQVQSAAAVGLGSGASVSGLAIAARRTGASATGSVTASTTGTVGFIGGTAKLGLVVFLAATPVVVGGDVAHSEPVPAPVASASVASTGSDDLGLPVVDEPVPSTNPTTSPATSPSTTPSSNVSLNPDQDTEGGNGKEANVSQDPAPSSPNGDEATPSTDNPDTSVPQGPEEDADLLDTTTGAVEDVVEGVTDDLVQPLVDETLNTVDGALDTVQDDVVDPLLDDAVEPLVDDTVDTVDETVSTVQDDVVDPLVDDTVDTVDETVSTVPDDVVDPLLDDVVDTAVDEPLAPIGDGINTPLVDDLLGGSGLFGG